MTTSQFPVQSTVYHPMPKHVGQTDQTVRVYGQYQQIQLQIRHPKHYMNASLTPAEARELARRLLAAAAEAEG